MSRSAERTDPKLWEKVKSEVTDSSKGGRSGQWSARKAQLAVQEYKRRGGGYVGKKRDDNSLQQWTDENWGTRSGNRSRDTGERYLPESARDSLSDDEYERTSAKKRRDTQKGQQYSGQPEDVAAKSAVARKVEHLCDQTREKLYEEAKKREIPGRSSMRKAELAEAIAKDRTQ